MSKKIKIIKNVEDTIEDFNRALSKETLNLVEVFCEHSTKDNALRRRFAANFVSQYMEHLLMEALMDYPKDAPKKEQMKHVFDNFKDLKAEFQEQVANAFSRAMEGYSGQNIDYYCQIKVQPEPTSKLMN